MARRRFYLSPALRESLWFLVLILLCVHAILLLTQSIYESELKGEKTPEQEAMLKYLEEMAKDNLYNAPR